MSRYVVRCLGLLALLVPCASSAQDEPTPEPPEPRNWTDDVAKSAELFTVHRDGRTDEALEQVAAYKWSNNARRVRGDRLCLLFVDEGRPVASCKVYPTGRSMVHTFISFTDQPIVARREETVVWSPPKSGPEYVVVDGVPAPQAKANRRLLQMKAIAREFSARTGDGEAKRQSSSPELRLLPKPIYRYAVEEARDDGLVDGAVFCFVAEGGNPQILMLLEAVRDGEEMTWRVGFSRRTFAMLEVTRDDREVWSVEFLPGRMIRSTAGFHKIDLPVVE